MLDLSAGRVSAPLMTGAPEYMQASGPFATDIPIGGKTRSSLVAGLDESLRGLHSDNGKNLSPFCATACAGQKLSPSLKHALHRI